MEMEHLKKGGKVKKTSRVPAKKQNQKQKQTVNVHVNVGKSRGNPRRPQQKQQQQPSFILHEGFTRLMQPGTSMPHVMPGSSIPHYMPVQQVGKPVTMQVQEINKPVGMYDRFDLSSLMKDVDSKSEAGSDMSLPSVANAELAGRANEYSIYDEERDMRRQQDIQATSSSEAMAMPAINPFVPEGVDMKEKIHANPTSFAKMGNIEKIENLQTERAQLENAMKEIDIILGGKGSRGGAKLNTFLSRYNIVIPFATSKAGIQAVKQYALEALKEKKNILTFQIQRLKK